MLGRFIYSLVPLVLTITTFILAIVSLFGSFKSNTNGINNVYFLQLNLTGVKVPGFTRTTLAYNAGVYPLYQIGAGGFCYGTFDWQDKPSIDGCKTTSAPFWYNFVGLFEDSWSGNITRIADLPQGISDYNKVIKGVSSAIWVLLILVVGFSFIMSIMGFFSAFSKMLSLAILVISAINAFAAVIAAALATGMFLIYRQKFNDSSAEFGATAHVGGTGFGLVWGMAAAAVLGSFFWVFTTCFGSTSSSAPPDDDAGGAEEAPAEE